MNDQRIHALHIIPSLSIKHGGPSYAVRAIARALATMDVDVTIATTDDDGNDARLKVPLGEPVDEGGIGVYYFRRDIRPYKISFGLARWLRSNTTRFDIIHVHALFSFSSTIASHYAHHKGVRYIVRPLGVLNRYGLEKRRPLLKKLTMPLIENRILRHSAAIHYTSEAERVEAGQISEMIASHKSVVIPLPVEAVNGNAEDFIKHFPQIAGRKVILFLSRIDEKKGIELLLNAFAGVRRRISDAVLVIAGAGAPSYVEGLRRRARELNIADHVIWTGHLEGKIKVGAFSAANVFTLPSHSENFGIAAAEAIALGVPTVVTESVGISEEMRRHDAGVVVKNDPTELAAALSRILSEPGFGSRLAANGRQFASENYGINTIGRRLRELYDSVLETRRG